MSKKLKQNKNVGIKFDSQKPRMDLLPPEALEECSRVLTYGAIKYSRANWAKGINVSRLIAAAMRHINTFNQGIDLDEETETLHIANATVNLMFAIWMMKHRPDLDDRWAKEYVVTSKHRTNTLSKNKTSSPKRRSTTIRKSRRRGT